MAPKKNKSKVEEESIANMSTGWYKSKMSEAAVQEQMADSLVFGCYVALKHKFFLYASSLMPGKDDRSFRRCYSA